MKQCVMHKFIQESCIKLPSGYVYEMYVKHKSISCSDLIPIPKISYCIHVIIQNLKQFWPQAFQIGILKLELIFT